MKARTVNLIVYLITTLSLILSAASFVLSHLANDVAKNTPPSVVVITNGTANEIRYMMLIDGIQASGVCAAGATCRPLESDVIFTPIPKGQQ